MHISPTLAVLDLVHRTHEAEARTGDPRLSGSVVELLQCLVQGGLLHPLREQSSRYRLYDEQQMRRLRVVVLLRDAGYTFNVIQPVLDELAAGRPEKAIVAVEKRREELTRTSWACIEALTFFQHYVSKFGPQYIFAPR